MAKIVIRMRLNVTCIRTVACRVLFASENSDYFPIQNELFSFHNRDSVFTARYGLSLQN